MKKCDKCEPFLISQLNLHSFAIFQTQVRTFAHLLLCLTYNGPIRVFWMVKTFAKLTCSAFSMSDVILIFLRLNSKIDAHLSVCRKR